MLRCNRDSLAGASCWYGHLVWDQGHNCAALGSDCAAPWSDCAPLLRDCAPCLSSCAPLPSDCAPLGSDCAPSLSSCAPSLTSCASLGSNCAPLLTSCARLWSDFPQGNRIFVNIWHAKSTDYRSPRSHRGAWSAFCRSSCFSHFFERVDRCLLLPLVPI